MKIEDDEPRDVRIQLLLTASEVAEIDAFRRRTKIRARNKAIRALMARGLKAFQEQEGSGEK